MVQSLEQILRRLSTYPWYEVLVEVLVIWLVVYLALRFLRGTRGAGVIKGFAFILIGLTLGIRVLGGWTDAFSRINFIYDRFLGLVALLLIVVFQPELRRAMMRLGETRLFRTSRSKMLPVIEAVTSAAEFLSKSQFGALIAIQREVGLEGLAATGVTLNAHVSDRLLQAIFWPNSPLHDLGVVIKDDTILAASVQFPLIEEGALPPDLGSRHRAGLGISAETDCIVVIVSEETGQISIAEGGRLERDIPRDHLAEILLARLRATPVDAGDDDDESHEPDTTVLAGADDGQRYKEKAASGRAPSSSSSEAA